MLCIGGRFGDENNATTAKTQNAFYNFKQVRDIFEI